MYSTRLQQKQLFLATLTRIRPGTDRDASKRKPPKNHPFYTANSENVAEAGAAGLTSRSWASTWI